MSDDYKEPTEEELGLKFGTEAEAFWTKIKDKMLKEIQGAKYEIEIDEVVLAYAEKKIKEEEDRKI